MLFYCSITSIFSSLEHEQKGCNCLVTSLMCGFLFFFPFFYVSRLNYLGWIIFFLGQIVLITFSRANLVVNTTNELWMEGPVIWYCLSCILLFGHEWKKDLLHLFIAFDRNKSENNEQIFYLFHTALSIASKPAVLHRRFMPNVSMFEQANGMLRRHLKNKIHLIYFYSWSGFNVWYFVSFIRHTHTL